MAKLGCVWEGLEGAANAAFGPGGPADQVPSLLTAFKLNPFYILVSTLLAALGVALALGALVARRRAPKGARAR